MNQVISDVDDNEPVPIFRSFSKDSFTDGESSVPLLYSIQINLKVLKQLMVYCFSQNLFLIDGSTRMQI